MCGDIFVVIPAGDPAGPWIEARDAIKHSASHRTAPTTKNIIQPSVSIEKPY